MKTIPRRRTKIRVGTEVVRTSVCQQVGHNGTPVFVGVTHEGWVFQCPGGVAEQPQMALEGLGPASKPRRSPEPSHSTRHTFVAIPPDAD